MANPEYFHYDFSTLSRRGLVKLCNEYDDNNKGKLSEFAMKNNYEEERLPEKLIDVLDEVESTIKYINKNSGIIESTKDILHSAKNIIKSKQKV